ncbi:DNA-binding protein [halophilic archaeon]|nr:DNA-binding protein [halophilic archaeon]
MAILSEFNIPATEFVLTETLVAVPDMHIEIQRVVAGSDRITPYFWASGGDFNEFEQELEKDETVNDVLTIDDHKGNERFYRVIWDMKSPSIIGALTEAEATVLEASSGDNGEWRLRVLFPLQEDLAEFRNYCLENGIQFEVKRVYSSENPQEEAEYGVTDLQREALVAAFHADYFQVPRGKSMTELAEEISISRNALSARLRRGQHNLLSHTLIHEKDE